MRQAKVEANILRNVTPLRVGRAGTGVDIAHAAVYLASDESVWYTGQVMVVDAGISIFDAANKVRNFTPARNVTIGTNCYCSIGMDGRFRACRSCASTKAKTMRPSDAISAVTCLALFRNSNVTTLFCGGMKKQSRRSSALVRQSLDSKLIVCGGDFRGKEDFSINEHRASSCYRVMALCASMLKSILRIHMCMCYLNRRYGRTRDPCTCVLLPVLHPDDQGRKILGQV
eukprot:SAG31_NODE_1486_length_8148_cov_6.234439_3_plen_229_part_00